MGTIDFDQYDHTRAESEGLSIDEQIRELPGDIKKTALASESKKGTHRLDKPLTRRRWRRIKSWWDYERARQSDNRRQRMKYHEYYDGDQWADDDKTAVEARGQKACVFNLIQPTIEWMCGTERRTRIDYNILPRTADDTEGAETKTKLMKYVDDVNKSGFLRSQAFDDAVISGLGWIDHGVRSDDDGEPLYDRYEDWRNVWHDSHGKTLTGDDWRYVFRAKWVDFDIAVAMFPDRADVLRLVVQHQDEYEHTPEEHIDDDTGVDQSEGRLIGQGDYPDVKDFDGEVDTVIYNQRERVRLIECQYKELADVKIMRSDDEPGIGTLDGETFNPKNEAMQQLVDAGYVSLVSARRMVVRQMIFAGRWVLADEESPYRHRRFSLVPIWCYREKKTGLPYGAVKRMMDPQDDLNKRNSKALFILSSNRVVIDGSKVEDMDEFEEEKNQPDGTMDVRGGKDSVYFPDDRGLAADHVRLMELDREYIHHTSGVNKDNVGQQSNAISGRAVIARQEQGNTVNARPFDNLRLGIQLSGEIKLSLIEQFYTKQKIIRLTDDKGKPQFHEINTPDPETGDIKNDITARMADFVVDTQAWSASVRQAQFQQLGEMLTKMPPEVGVAFIPLWLDLSDIPGKEQWVALAQKVTGQHPDNEDPNDPEVQARQEQEKLQAEIQKKLLELEMSLKEAAAEKDRATAEEKMAKAKQLMASIRVDQEELDIKRDEVKVKKADVLAKIEAAERQPVEAKPKPKAKTK